LFPFEARQVFLSDNFLTRFFCHTELRALSWHTAGKWQQSQVTGALDRPCQLALVSGTRTGLAPGTDLPFLGDEPAQHFMLLVIDLQVFVGTELADTRLGVIALSSGLCLVSWGLVAHVYCSKVDYF
jgi:hypothetical protein